MGEKRKVVKKSTIKKAFQQLRDYMEELENVVLDYEILEDDDPVFTEKAQDLEVHCGKGSQD